MMHSRFKPVVAIAVALACGSLRAQAAQQPDVEAQWRAFLAEGELDDVNAAVDAMDAVGYDLTSVDKDKCKSGRAALERAQRQVPVSVAVHRAAWLCAEATGDHAAAERAAGTLGALAKHAFHQADRGAWPRPVRIALLADAYALLATAGLDYRYEFYTQLHPAPYFPLSIAAADPATGVEKLVQFDYVDTLQALDRKDPAYGTPRLRMVYADSFIENAAKRDEIAAVDLRAVAAAMVEDAPAKQIEVLRQAAQAGGMNALSTWLGICVRSPGDKCGDGLVDALLPLVEARQAYPTMLLALAYQEGVGVERDQKAAEAMLDAADKLWERRGASVSFAQLQALMHPRQPLAPFLQKRLQASQEAGNAAARVVALSFEIGREGSGYSLTPADEALLASPDHNGLGQGLLLLAGWYESRDKAKSDAYLKRAAEANSAGALRLLAMQLRNAQGARPPSAEAIALMEKAANGGDTMAMRYLAYYAYTQGDPRRAEDWLLPAAARSDVDALFFLANLWASGHKDLSGDAAKAVEMYKSLAMEKQYGARARRELAGMAMQGRGMAKDLAQARAWLTQDAEAGDAESQTQLGSALLRGMLGPADQEAGRRWLERAVEAGSVDAMNEYGLWLHDHGKDSADHVRGADLSRRAADKGDIGAMNNAAWMLCVSRHAEVRKPADGMAYARKLEAIPDVGPGTLDTIAACYAAVGDFARATELQQQVVDAMGKLPSEEGNASMKNMKSRLALFRSGKPYVQDAADAP